MLLTYDNHENINNIAIARWFVASSCEQEFVGRSNPRTSITNIFAHLTIMILGRISQQRDYIRGVSFCSICAHIVSLFVCVIVDHYSCPI